MYMIYCLTKKSEKTLKRIAKSMKFKLYEATAIDEDNIKKYQFYRPETISLEKFEETLIHVFDNLLDYEIFHGDKTLIKVLIVK